ncbi:hypothetical protein ASF50_11205 [Nocardioides sp. Leaf307]|nr:hypothetical protein ASF47_03125 [Nocardioides sp. Leaf285]KQQ41546.1 hypothetical protein ASF50_11205 [Nocardioides sp. Leaf307]
MGPGWVGRARGSAAHVRIATGRRGAEAPAALVGQDVLVAPATSGITPAATRGEGRRGDAQ